MANKKRMGDREEILKLIMSGIQEPNKIYREYVERGNYISRQQVYIILKELRDSGYIAEERYTVKKDRIRYKPLTKGRSSKIDT